MVIYNSAAFVHTVQAETIKAQNAQNTFLQYGTLLKPLFSGMAHMKERLEHREHATHAFEEWQHKDQRCVKFIIITYD